MTDKTMTLEQIGIGDEFSLLRQCAQRCVDNGGEWYGPVQALAILGEHVGEPALLADAAFMGMATPEAILRLLDKAEASNCEKEKCRRIQENRDYWFGVADELRQDLLAATNAPRHLSQPAERGEAQEKAEPVSDEAVGDFCIAYESSAVDDDGLDLQLQAWMDEPALESEYVRNALTAHNKRILEG